MKQPKNSHTTHHAPIKKTNLITSKRWLCPNVEMQNTKKCLEYIKKYEYKARVDRVMCIGVGVHVRLTQTSKSCTMQKQGIHATYNHAKYLYMNGQIYTRVHDNNK